MSLAWNTLRRAVLVLTGPGCQRHRLAVCFAEHLNCLRPRDLPSESQELFNRIRSDVRVIQQKTKEEYFETVFSLTEDQIVILASSIVAIFDQLARYQPVGELDESRDV